MSLFSREITAFQEIARQRSIRHAATQLNISPSALSRQMKILEGDIGAQLFLRQARGVELTPIGRLLLAQLESWSSEESELLSQLRGFGDLVETTINLGVMECLANSFLVRCMQELQCDNLPLQFNIVMGGTHELVEQLLEQKLDAMIAFNVSRHARIRTLYTYESRIGVVVHPEHSLASQESVWLAQCLHERLALPTPSLSIYSRVNNALLRCREPLHIVLKSNSLSLIKSFVQAGEGVSFLSRYDVLEELANETLAFVPLKNRRLSEQLAISVPNTENLRPELSIMLTTLDKYIYNQAAL